jgi:hypothetical protein
VADDGAVGARLATGGDDDVQRQRDREPPRWPAVDPVQPGSGAPGHRGSFREHQRKRRRACGEVIGTGSVDVDAAYRLDDVATRQQRREVVVRQSQVR